VGPSAETAEDHGNDEHRTTRHEFDPQRPSESRAEPDAQAQEQLIQQHDGYEPFLGRVHQTHGERPHQYRYRNEVDQRSDEEREQHPAANSSEGETT